MSEWLFPLFGVACLYLIAVPALTLVSKAALTTIRRHDPTRLGSKGAYLLLISPVAVPTLWIASAALHEAEPGRALAACAVQHLPTELCLGALALAVVAPALPLISALRGAWRTRAVALRHLTVSPAMTRRLREMCAADPRLCDVARLICVVEDSSPLIFASGLLRPRIWVSTGTLAALTTSALLGAIAHERAHIESRDPLRSLGLWTCLAFNPLRRLIRSDAAAWMLAREADCDRQAVSTGADPLALAEAIVRVAQGTGGARSAAVLSLQGAGVAGVELRVRLLLGYADVRPVASPSRLGVPLLVAVLTALLVLPHGDAEAVLGGVHAIVDKLSFLLGSGH